MAKSKYAVTDGSFVWNKSSISEARKSARSMSKDGKFHVVTPKRGGMRVVESYYRKKKV